VSEKSFKYRIYPTKAQEQLLIKTFGCVRWVYNNALVKRIALYEQTGGTVSRFELIKELPSLKALHPWLGEVDSTALQASVENLDRAYVNFFTRIKRNSGKPGFPKFKSKRSRQSFKSKSGLAVSDNAIRIAKVGWINASVSRPIEGRILSITISRTNTGRYYASVCCTDVLHVQLPKTGKTVGVDLGLHDVFVLSTGEKIGNPRYLTKAEKRIVREQRHLSRKQKGSANYNRQRLKLAKAHERVVNRRTDFTHKTTTRLINEFDTICIEDLNVKGMIKNHHLARALSDVSFGEIVRQLEYKSAWYGKRLVRADRFFASTQICSVCGEKNPATRDLKVRLWVCPVCKTRHDRDINAAVNIATVASEGREPTISVWSTPAERMSDTLRSLGEHSVQSS